MGASLSAAQVGRFHREGYVVLDGLLDAREDLDPIVEEYEMVLDRLARELFAQGKLSSSYGGMGFEERARIVMGESGSAHAQYFDFSLPPSPAPDTPMWVGPAVFAALRNPKVLDAVESLIGGEIYSNPIQHVRIKPPEAQAPRHAMEGTLPLGATPWHQDNGVQMPEADATDMVTVWFAITDTTEEMGCLQVVPRSHRAGLLQHCPGPGGLRIPDSLFSVADAMPLPVARRTAILLHKHTCHGSLPNRSDRVRWSFDLRYNPTGQATGRPVLPGFVARSRADPASELREAALWARLWEDCRSELASSVASGGEAGGARFYRWEAADPICA